MKVIETPIRDLLVLEPEVFGDDRGFFLESWNERRFREAAGASLSFVQDNFSRSVRGVLRGLHYQLGRPQGKLVQVLRGKIFDVAVDLRRSSPSFAHWHAVELDEDSHRQLWIPPGFAHGFMVTSKSADVFYKVTDYYAPEHERCISWNDPDLNVTWPVAGLDPRLSAKDKRARRFAEAEVFA